MHYYLAIISIPLWGMGLYLLGSRLRLFLTAYRASGTISGVKEVAGVRGRIFHYPIVFFKALDGSEHSIVGATGSSKPSGKLGSTVTVLYDARHPEKAMVHTLMHFWMAPMVFLILAGAATFAFLDAVQFNK